MNISVCCPSYRRPDKCDTLKCLPFVRVYVDGSEVDAYRAANPGAAIIRCDDGIQGNVCRVRNHILDREFASGADVVVTMDDDVKEFARWTKGERVKSKRVRLETEDFHAFIERYTLMAEDIGAYLWGMNLNFDKSVYREYSPFSTTSVVLGPFTAVRRGSEIRYDESLPLKEDYDLSLQHLNRHRVILRLNAWHYICKQAENTGGCATYRNIERERSQLEKLQRKWGTEIVQTDEKKMAHMREGKNKGFDFNPIIKVPIKGL